MGVYANDAAAASERASAAERPLKRARPPLPNDRATH